MSEELKIAQQTAESFEIISISNGNTHWTTSALREWLGYIGTSSFKQAISRAMTVCQTLQIPTYEHFTQIDNKIENKHEFKLTRFACYLIAMNGDPKKPQVARAQAYFAQMAYMLSGAMETADGVERVYVRKEITDRYKSLSITADSRDIKNYADFNNAGYMGLYNMGIKELRKIKGLGQYDKRTPLDFMGTRELAANLFRITETEGRIQADSQIRGQSALESTAHAVGQDVRKVMDIKPEELAKEIPENILETKKRIKKTRKKFDQIDKLPKCEE